MKKLIYFLKLKKISNKQFLIFTQESVMKRLSFFVIMFLIALTTCKAQIKVTAQIIKGDKPSFCPTDCMEVKLRFDNVPKNTLDIPNYMDYKLINLELLNHKNNLEKINDSTYTTTISVKIVSNFDGKYAYIFVYGINDYKNSLKRNNVNQIALAMESYNDESLSNSIKK